ncbi:methyl-accepting chemotaxis protein [Marinobacter salinexigens]|uniref:Methyl-accepting chemotaxis protein n=1 Tax=Marinobacter salinexigens TaxID=2919747 RepID=A0A5B0VNE7_9GAMM|nr:methyl-accepting chemotaxis protein [Marinobacter salinexigens]KAA1175953.1 methyl-accepting chemotaxis protein [Marinobacter salinexigens]
MTFVTNLSMRGKLLTLILPALLVILFFAGDNIRRNTTLVTNMNQLQAMATLAKQGDPLVEELQRERGRSAVLLASQPGSDGEQQASTALEAQRGNSDRALATYRQGIESLLAETEFDSTITGSLDRFRQDIGKLDQLRRGIDRREVAPGESAKRYTGLIMEVVDRIPMLVRQASDPELSRQISAYHALASAAEMAGRERAVGAGLVRSGNFDLPTLGRTARLAGQQQALLETAASRLASGSPIREKIDAFGNRTEARDMQDIRDTLFSSQSGMYALESSTWFTTATQRINAMNGIRASLLGEIEALAARDVADARNSLMVSAVIAGAAVLLVVIMMVMIIRTIHQQVSRLLTGVRHAMDNKDLTQPIEVLSKDENGVIAEAINELFRHFSQALLQIDRSSIQLATATEETSSTAGQNADQVRRQQQQIEQVAAATEEMSATSEEISTNVLQVADASTRAMEKSRNGEKVLHSSVAQIRTLAESVQEVNQVIAELEERSGSISEVVDVIRNVADQTNLLALNAAIEAARAGEHGRGFAVVADEVRALARQTHESTTQIEDIINSFKGSTDSASRSITASHQLADSTSEQASEMETTFAEILMDVNSISDMATQIAASSEEQVAVTRELAGNMESVSESALLTLTGSQEITQVTEEQARLARQLQDLANEFKVTSTN